MILVKTNYPYLRVERYNDHEMERSSRLNVHWLDQRQQVFGGEESMDCLVLRGAQRRAVDGVVVLEGTGIRRVSH
jgi:hypothetical protein